MNASRILAAFIFGAFIASSLERASADTLFSDNFDTNSASQWKVFAGYYQRGDASDFTIDWAYDYSQQTYALYADAASQPTLETVPSAPHSGGTTFGLKLTVNNRPNKNAGASENFGLSLYPANQSFSGDFVLKFDLFMSYGGFAETGVGTSKYASYGINFKGDKVNWTSPEIDAAFTAGPGSQSSDGLWFINTGDGAAIRNFRGLQGNANAGGAVLARTQSPDNDSAGDSIFLDRDGDGTPDNSVAVGGAFDGQVAPYVQKVFPSPPAELRGIPGKTWIPVEVSQVHNIITWKMNSWVISSYTNATPYTSGDIMIGFMDIIGDIADQPDQTWCLFDNVRVETVRTVVVDTADNTSPAGDGHTSLLEALQQLQNNDTIAFNIPGPGPHYIITPPGGYPIVTNDNITIDGYTQPGASPNAGDLTSPNTAQIQIVLDSRAGGAASLADFSGQGYSDSEAAILSVLGASGFTLRGVSVLSAAGDGAAAKPFIHGVALLKDASRVRIQGCWFGVDPAVPTSAGVAGGKTAVTSRQWDAVTTPASLIIGTDSDGIGDVGEVNIICGQLLALGFQSPDTRVSGNFVNFLPDGSIFDFAAAGVGVGAANQYEFYENTMGVQAVIGTDSDTINDAGEMNFVGPIQHRSYIDFAGQPAAAVVAGNYMGFDQLGNPAYTNAQPSSFISFTNGSTIRIGSSFKGDPAQPAQASLVAADGVAFNYIANLQSPFLNIDGPPQAAIAMDGNIMVNNYGSFPADNSFDWTVYYGSLLAGLGVEDKPVLSTNSTPVNFIGTLPLELDSAFVISAIARFYLADPVGMSQVSTNYPLGWVQPLAYLGSYLDNGQFDSDPAPGAFNFDVSGLNLGTNVPGSVICIATYTTLDGAETTVPYSDPVAVSPAPPSAAIALATPVLKGTKLQLKWAGGNPPYTVQRKDRLDEPWATAAVTFGASVVLRANAPYAFYRVVGN